MLLLLVQDLRPQRSRLAAELTELSHEVVAVASGAEALAWLERSDQGPDLVLTDLYLADFDAMVLIRRVRSAGSQVPFLITTDRPSVRSAVAAFQAGASDYLVRPIPTAELERRIREIRAQLERPSEKSASGASPHDPLDFWFPETAAGRHIRQLIARVRNTDLTVLITGEPGTGKGMTARLLHTAGRRASGPFVTVNCAAIPEGLLESELFGHVRGAFTGAGHSHEGLFAAASGGTLFLDEISALTLTMQSKLLHAIEEKSVRQVGSTEDRQIDLRIVVATNRELDQMVAQGEFREDLRFRLDVFRIHLPPLREQRDALPAAVTHFLARHERRGGTRVTLSSEVWERIVAYDWPGNLRELEITLERAALLCDGEVIRTADLPPAMRFSAAARSSRRGTLRERVEAFERLTILETIERVGGDRRRAAQELGTSLSTVYRKLQEREEEPES